MGEISIQDFEESDLGEVEKLLETLAFDHQEGSSERRLLELAALAVFYVRGQKSYLYFREFVRTRDDVPPEILLKYELLEAQFRQQFEGMEFEESPDLTP